MRVPRKLKKGCKKIYQARCNGIGLGFFIKEGNKSNKWIKKAILELKREEKRENDFLWENASKRLEEWLKDHRKERCF